MERFHSPPTSRPHTPPYTPQYGKGKRRLDSPAPSIHPTETTSPEKVTPSKRSTAVDGVHVQELAQDDIIPSEVDLVYPEELEEMLSSSSFDSDDSNDHMGEDQLDPFYPSSSDEDDPSSGMARRMSRLHCSEDSAEARKFEKGRRLRRMSKRMGSRVFKRTHSETLVKNDEGVVEVEMDVDEDAMGDQDLTASQRRLRRRVRGPETVEERAIREAGRPWMRGPMTPERNDKFGTSGPLSEGGDIMEIDDEDE